MTIERVVTLTEDECKCIIDAIHIAEQDWMEASDDLSKSKDAEERSWGKHCEEIADVSKGVLEKLGELVTREVPNTVEEMFKES